MRYLFDLVIHASNMLKIRKMFVPSLNNETCLSNMLRAKDTTCHHTVACFNISFDMQMSQISWRYNIISIIKSGIISND